MKPLLYCIFFPLVAGFVAILLGTALGRLPRWIVSRAWRYERRRFGRHRFLPKRRALWSVAALGAAVLFMPRGVVASPILGLIALLFVLPVLKGYIHFEWFRARRRLGEEALSFLYQLRGMLLTGRSLPTVIQEMAGGAETAFAGELGRLLVRFEGGKDLRTAFQVFLKRNHLGNLSIAFSLLLEAHQNGLPLLPVLDRFVPDFEETLQFQRRVFELRSSAIAQGLWIAAIPWFLLAVLFFFQPELRSSSAPSVIAAGVAWQIAGLFALWRVSCFR